MEVVPFIAESAAEAVERIRAQLGPEAVVLNVRQLPAGGLKRLWQKPRIEVLAAAPPPAAAKGDRELSQLRQELAEIRQQLPQFRVADALTPAATPAARQSAPGGWTIGPLLENMGLLPVHADRVVEQLRAHCSDMAPAAVGEQLRMAREVLEQVWTMKAAVPDIPLRSTHVFVGPPGTGKTTCLCKWLTRSVLLEGRAARVWRLDGHGANTAESLGVYCDILGVPVERCVTGAAPPGDAELVFVDLPGVPANNPAAVMELAESLKQFDSARVHLVLNASYETAHLIAQTRAFSVLPLTDLIVTHLDEETRWGKLWNLVLGTNYSLRWFATGQNIPGDFAEASASALLSQHFPHK